MEYQQIAPPSFISNYVQYFWVLKNNSQQKSFKTIVDGCPGLIFQNSEQGSFYQNNKKISNLFIFGQATRFAEILVGPSVTIGVCFYPQALKLVFGLNAHELTDTCLDIDSIAKKHGKYLKEQLLNAQSVTAQIDLLATYIHLNAEKNQAQQDKIIKYVLLLMIQSGGSILLKELQQQVKISERSLERRFKQHVGISPKLFSRICGFQSSLAQLNSNGYHKLSDVAYANGYADQSHFIRTFKAFSGLSPYQFQNYTTGAVPHLPEFAG
jgi:AraC-like DNA-binding protein